MLGGFSMRPPDAYDCPWFDGRRASVDEQCAKTVAKISQNIFSAGTLE
jgi:hypothetical protein